MKATLIIERRENLAESMFTQVVIWRVPSPKRGSEHLFKYRLAFVVDGVCVLRYDNEAGKGDHKHIGAKEFPCTFANLEKLIDDFEADVRRWIDENA